MSRVTIVIPFYNAAPWLAQTIQSALAQTWTDLEIIAVDDGSTDGSAEIVRSTRDDRVCLLQQRNAGASAARNHALQRATGDYVQFLDADDLLSRGKIEEQVGLLDTCGPGYLAVCDTVYFSDGDDPQSGQRAVGYSSLNSDDPVQWLIDLWTPGSVNGTNRWGMVQPGAWLVPRDLVTAVGPWNVHPSPDDDGEYFARVLVASRGVRWSPGGGVFYRQFTTGSSLSGQRSRMHMEGRLRSVDGKARAVMPRVNAQNECQARRALARQYMDVAYHAYPDFMDVVGRAEQSATALGGYSAPFFGHSRAGALVERVCGWKAARRISRALHALRAG